MKSAIQRVRDDYVSLFKQTAQSMKRDNAGSELKFQLSTGSSYRKIVCVDFYAKDRGVIFFSFDKPPSCSGALKHHGLSIDVKCLRWDNAIFESDANLSEDAFSAWFEKWFDPEEKNWQPDSDGLSCRVHSLEVAARYVAVDFGTAPTDAFWELLDVLADSGATHVSVADK